MYVRVRAFRQKGGTATRSLPANRYLHGRAGRGAPGGAVVALVSGLDLSMGETGTLGVAGGVATAGGCTYLGVSRLWVVGPRFGMVFFVCVVFLFLYLFGVWDKTD